MMNEKVFLEATIGNLHEAMKRGELTCADLVQRYLARIERYDQQLNAVIRVNPYALEQARALDEAFGRSGLTGPLHGIPVLLKDNVDTSFMPTTAGSSALAQVTPDEDGWIVKRLQAAGAVILAKMNLHEFAVWGETVSSVLGQTLNPYDLTRTPGGSSGGTGAGIAADFGVIGIGTDTVNSVRSPASACCLVGLRPTLGLISRSGIVPYSLTQDTAGPITRTVEDAVKTLDALVGYDPLDPLTAWSVGHLPETYTAFLKPDGLTGKNIGVLRSFFGKDAVHEPVNRVMAQALKALEAGGAQLVDLTDGLAAQLDSGRLISEVSVHLYDLKRDLGGYLESLGDKVPYHCLEALLASGLYHPGIEENLKTAASLDTDSEAYQQRLLLQKQLREDLMVLMAERGLDLLVFPHQKRLVVPVGGSQVDRNGVLGAVTGFPSIVVPAGFSEPTETAPIGVPVGMELLGRPWCESVLIEASYAFEQETRIRKPPVL
ncbi:Asp-tRNAAsn/Glu-tRNAGln amidotransferase A subunit [Acidaminobacter hydrogenoformans DSM 2784]|uniref:Asp-tRNAAsn/Glu-tRNAGln amidotransferase A subunit n=2 Tax=Acidaminobacter TaxID=65402 RepID=A0A1G5RWQ3_9FIRM|nr:Asp-tRNAAsn/Glu-tRNAGln amidotransferase A subunit [Acidaminobacter hydrogenoformans DSM 2784]